mgnify:FL=1
MTSMEEPTDEMLAQIIYEAAVQYREEHEGTKKKSNKHDKRSFQPSCS